MRDTSGHDAFTSRSSARSASVTLFQPRARCSRAYASWTLVVLAMGLLSTGCVEFNHFGQISDRQGTWPVNDVVISQQQSDGSWKRIGNSDGKGKWNILKANIKGGGRIKLEKPGYYTLNMSESEFLQQNNILLEASDDSYQSGRTGSSWDLGR
ncbi:MAG: hypothetical protein KF841_12670 [Phycisphaerae bacterium]|nr:hypothetical protein [Phycisphaerae bacterium]